MKKARWGRIAGGLGGLVVAVLVLAGRAGGAQTAPAEQKPGATAAAPASPVTSAHPLTEKQRALADQADKLLAMATELKHQVDRTNKNILSVKVVEKAEEIEQYARRLKDQAKK